MLLKTTFSLFLLMALMSCKQNKHLKTTEQKKNDSITVYPLNAMLDNQIEDLKKSPYYIYKKTSINSKIADSIPFPLDSFTAVINHLKTYNIDTIGIKENYIESTFHDLGTKSISLVYTTTNSKMNVINQTILLNQDNNELKNAFIRVIDQNNDSQIQYNFKPNKSLRISTIKFKNNKQEVVENVFINWNDTEN